MSVTGNGDGLSFSGYAAVFNTRARIAGQGEDFDEQIAPGAFRAVAAGDYPALMFEHGRHPLIGTMPLGRITGAREDRTGLWIEARLTDNWLIRPVRDAIADQAVSGMSFRFTVNDGGERWMDRRGDVALRTLTSISVPELGPVVFPAYAPTTASVRSALDTVLPPLARSPASSPHEPMTIVHSHDHGDGHGRQHSHLHEHANDNRHSGDGHLRTPGHPDDSMPSAGLAGREPGGETRVSTGVENLDVRRAVAGTGYQRRHREDAARDYARLLKEAKRTLAFETGTASRAPGGPRPGSRHYAAAERVTKLETMLAEACLSDPELIADALRQAAAR